MGLIFAGGGGGGGGGPGGQGSFQVVWHEQKVIA